MCSTDRQQRSPRHHDTLNDDAIDNFNDNANDNSKNNFNDGRTLAH
jgi:hypothetical protein